VEIAMAPYTTASFVVCRDAQLIMLPTGLPQAHDDSRSRTATRCN